VNNEIVIGERYTSILKTDTKMYQIAENVELDREDDVEHKPIIRNRTIKTSDFLTNLKNTFTNQTEILPAGCKYFQTLSNGYKILIVEEQPRIRTIKVNIGLEAVIEKLKMTGKLKEYGYENYLIETNSYPYSFQLSFPYVVFIILLNKSNELISVFPFFRLHPVTSLADYLFVAPLYNIPNEQNICLGGVDSFTNVFETVENIIETFWLNIYNKDYTNNIELYNHSEAYEVQDYLTWMYFTKTNPMFIYDVKWIKHHHNIGKMINKLKVNYAENRNPHGSYDYVYNSVFQSNSETLNPEPKAKNTCYFAIINNENISVGDEIIFDNKSYYLYSIITKDDGYSYDSVELEAKDGNLIRVPFNEFERELKSMYKPNFLKEVDVNGTIIKPDDIINCKIGDYNVYKKIKSIRTAVDGKIEVLIESDHYLIKNIDFDLVDTSNIKINGESLDKDKTYYITQSYSNYKCIYMLKKVKYDTVLVNRSGSFVIKFKDPNGNNVDINLNDYEKGESVYSFIEEDDMIDHDVIVNFDKMLINTSTADRRFKIIKNQGLLVNESYAMRDYDASNVNFDFVIEKILKENGTRLHIPGSLIDIDFKVGDPIVYANWLNPDDMLKISSIDKFEYVEEDKMLYVCSTTLNKEEHFRIPYVNFDNHSVNVGVIRKVISQYGEWKSGDKIKANSTGITNFPKKDVNTIIAFIDDGATKYPVALCSNLCTLWMNEETINKFDLISLKSTRWPKLDNAPINMDKIKWQHGDNFVSNNEDRKNVPINFLAKRTGTKYSFEYHYETGQGSLEWGTNATKSSLDTYYRRHGIIMPRISVTNPTAAVTKRGFPNMLGGYVINVSSRIFIRSEQLKEDF